MPQIIESTPFRGFITDFLRKELPLHGLTMYGETHELGKDMVIVEQRIGIGKLTPLFMREEVARVSGVRGPSTLAVSVRSGEWMESIISIITKYEDIPGSEIKIKITKYF